MMDISSSSVSGQLSSDNATLFKKGKVRRRMQQ